MRNKIIMLQTILVTALFFAGSTLAVSISLPGIEEELTEDRIDKLVYSYTFTEPEIQKISILNEDFIHVSLKDCKNYAKTGEPSIPVKPLRILLPQGTTVEDITIITGESIEIESIGSLNPNTLVEFKLVKKYLNTTLRDSVLLEYSKQLYIENFLTCHKKLDLFDLLQTRSISDVYGEYLLIITYKINSFVK